MFPSFNRIIQPKNGLKIKRAKNKIKNKFNFLICFLVLSTYFINAQNTDNALQGYYIAQSDTLMYSHFEFDGNGKVDIMGMGKGDYFTKGDSLIVFPDKSIFKFKIKENSLIGSSDWVSNGVWTKKDTLVINNRKNENSAKKTAELLHEYYRINKNMNQLELLLDNNINSLTAKIKDLCDRGLGKACLDNFGLILVNDYGGIASLLSTESNNELKKITENPEIIALGNKIIAMGEMEGHTVLGSYYYLIGEKNKAKSEWEKGAKKGSLKSSVAISEVEFEKGNSGK